MKYRYFIIILICHSCLNQKNELNQIPVVKGGIEYEQDKNLFSDKIRIDGTTIYDLLVADEHETDSIYGLAKFAIEEMDSSHLRPFDLYLFESRAQDDLKWYLLTINKENTYVIDKYGFNPDSLEIRLIYQHSSKLDHDGIAIELIENASTQDSLIIYNHYLEVFETGKIKLISKSNSHSEIFKLLTSDQSKTGNYSCFENDVKIELNLKDGVIAQNYSYKLSIFTPAGCVHRYLNIDSRIVNNSIALDSLGKFKLLINQNTVGISNTNFESACEDIFELNYELKKTDDNFR